MGIGWTRGLMNNFGWIRPRQIEHDEPNSPLMMLDTWKEDDALFDVVESIKDVLEDAPTWRIMRTISKFIPCQVIFCACRGGVFKGPAGDTRGWKNSVCTNFGCKHKLSDHVLNLLTASTDEFTALVQVVFDIINLQGTLENEKLKVKSERNYLYEEVFISIHRELRKSISRRSYMSFNINSLYGFPPFENTNIEQILLNFCMYIARGRKTELRHYLIVTKFVLVYFDTWLWPCKELPACILFNYKKDYSFYYQRFLIFCYLPRCIHSISPRYCPSKIFGRDVLRYTFREFRKKLTNWCTQESIVWTAHTKFYCLHYLSIYMDSLQKEVFAIKSPIWKWSCKISHFQQILNNPESRNQ